MRGRLCQEYVSAINKEILISCTGRNIWEVTSFPSQVTWELIWRFQWYIPLPSILPTWRIIVYYSVGANGRHKIYYDTKTVKWLINCRLPSLCSQPYQTTMTTRFLSRVKQAMQVSPCAKKYCDTNLYQDLCLSKSFGLLSNVVALWSKHRFVLSNCTYYAFFLNELYIWHTQKKTETKL